MASAADEICPPLEEIERFLSSGSAPAGLLAHVDSCSACRGMMDRLREDTTPLGDMLGRRSGGGEGASVGIPGYPILGEIHRGGQGVVFEAIQESTQRRVAVKVLREGAFADANDRARFEREVRILGQFRHPNIVAIHDSGVVDGRAYFVMDYIPGLPLDRWITSPSGAAGLRSILRLFQTICEAVNAAHLRGIIHRDLKPSNIRVDPDGQPHVLDFGLAKVAEGFKSSVSGSEPGAASCVAPTHANDGSKLETRLPQLDTRCSLPEAANYTETGQFLGSLPWASPEQAGGMASDLDVRTDVYSLGVVLFQLLTGQFPYEVVGPLRLVLDRIVNAEPLRPRQLNPKLDDEVETIVLRCLSKDRERRYQSAGELARDLGRYLAGEAIAAKRDSFGYVLRKQLSRNKLPVAVAVAFLATVTIGFGVSFTQWRAAVAGRTAAQEERGKAERAAVDAQREAQRATELSKFLSDLLLKADPLRQGRGDVTVREVVDDFQARLDAGDLGAQPETVAALRRVLGEVYQALGAYVEAERELRAALDARIRLLGEKHPDTAEVQNALGLLYLFRQRYGEAEPLLEAAGAALRAQGGDQAKHLPSVLLNLGVLRHGKNDPAGAERLFRQCLSLDPDDDTRAATAIQLAKVLSQTGRPGEAAEQFREALALRRQLYPGQHPQVAIVLNDLGLLLQSQGQLDEAQACIDEAVRTYRELFPAGHHTTGVSLNSLGLLRFARGDYAGSEAAHRESLAVLRKVLPPDHPHIATALLNLTNALKLQLKLDEAETYALEGIGMLRGATVGDDVTLAKLLYAYGDVLCQRERFVESESAFSECLAIRERLMPERWDPFFTKFALARALIGQKLYADAEQLLNESYAGLQSHPPDRVGRFAEVIEGFILLYETWEKPEQAATWHARLREWEASTQPASAPSPRLD